ncbi:MAG: PAS domain-containing sensor histidine kinase, partial [Polyangiaceae bacterium]
MKSDLGSASPAATPLSSEQLLGLVLDQLPVVLFATDRQGVILIARGKGAVRLAGAVGRSAFELFADSPAVTDNLRRALGGEAIITEGENDHVWWETRYMPLRGPEGAVEGVVGVTMDATARKRAEEDLKKANVRLTELDALKARFVANVSHELRTPLALVLGVTERLRRSAGEGAASARDLASIEHNARLLLKQVNDLLDVAKLDAGTTQPAYAEVDLARVVALAGAQFESIAAERGVAFIVVTPETLPAVVDPDMVEQVLFNLLSNAFKLTPRGGTVRCALERAEDQAALTVADSGPGVPPARRDAIFERFVQVERGDEQRFGGTGLGLSIVRDYVQLHHGTIAVDDATEGGARFVVRLPL